MICFRVINRVGMLKAGLCLLMFMLAFLEM